jgi:ubiquinone/menaquinone biosynthesis C-methylase UbiE
MADLSHANPTGRFSGLADVYDRCRPTYPAAVIDFLVLHCGLGPRSRLVDVGCGTGISSRLFAERGVPVVGVEPNEDMRRRAEAQPLPSGAPLLSYCEGRAEATGLPDGSADMVLSAQAFHWFDAEAALCEFHRILKPGGWVALSWNERDESDPFTAAYGAVIRTAPDAARVEGPRARAGEPLLTHPLYRDAERREFANEQALDEDGMLGRAFSASYAPREPAAAETLAAALRDVFARYQKDGRVVVRYVTSLYLARRAP